MENVFDTNIVCVSNDFMEQYFKSLKPEYLKVLMFYLWKKPEKIDLSLLSKETELDEYSIEMALKFLSKKKIINNDFTKNISISNKFIDFNEKKKNYDESPEIRFVAEKITGHTLTEKIENVLKKCYEDFDFDEDLIICLLEYCVYNTDNINANYIETIATNWWEMGIKTPNEAKQYTSQRAKKKKNIEYNAKENTINVAICNTCNDFYNNYKVLNTEYLKAQNNKKNTNDKNEKEKYNNQAVQLNGIIQKNKFDFVDSIIKNYEEKEPI